MKSSAENASASQTCRCSRAGTFSSDSSHEKKLACKHDKTKVFNAALASNGEHWDKTSNARDSTENISETASQNQTTATNT